MCWVWVRRRGRAVVLDAAGLRELHRLVAGLRGGVPGAAAGGNTQIGSPGP